MKDLNGLSLRALYQHFSETGLITPLIRLAYHEDLGPQSRDLTAQVLDPAPGWRSGVIVARESGVISGLACVPEILRVFGRFVRLRPKVHEGEAVAAGGAVAILEGPQRQMLRAERTILNFLGRLSGIATRTAAFRRAMGPGTRARLYDTRKTTPGMRVLEKYAVRCGGGYCHRLGLHDAVLIKDNHLAGLGAGELTRFITAAARRARALDPAPAFFEVEVDSLDQLRAVLACPRGSVDAVLLDNMSPRTLAAAVAARNAAGRGAPLLEASGGVTLESIRAVAASGVDRISVGSLTHHAVWLDLALDADAPARPARGRA